MQSRDLGPSVVPSGDSNENCCGSCLFLLLCCCSSGGGARVLRVCSYRPIHACETVEDVGNSGVVVAGFWLSHPYLSRLQPLLF